MIYKAFKIRIYPNKEQETQINKTLGCCRAVYNMMLYERKVVYEKLRENKRELYEYKYKTEKEYKEEFEWMKEADSVALQQTRLNLSSAYSNFFRSIKGKDRKYNFPRFKRKKNGSSYRTVLNGNNIEIDWDASKIKLPKLGWITYRDRRSNIPGIVKSATVRRTPSGKYFVSVLFEQELDLKPIEITDELKTKTIGLDMSLEKFFVDNNGNSPVYERLYRKYEPKLKKVQRRTRNKKQGSKNWYKVIRKAAIIYEKIRNKRTDFTQKLSHRIVRDYDVIVVEQLSLRGMSQALRLGKSVMDLGYSDFIRQLQYKSLWNNKILIQADRWFASSKTCSVCGFVNKKLQLSDRIWDCPNCGEILDRDRNAGVNLRNFGLEKIGLGESEFKSVEFKTYGGGNNFPSLSLNCETEKSVCENRNSLLMNSP